MDSLSYIHTYEAEDRAQSGSTHHHTWPALTKHLTYNGTSHRQRARTRYRLSVSEATGDS